MPKSKKGMHMRIQFKLQMNDLVVQDQLVDQIEIIWISNVDQDEIMDLSSRWITTQNFLTHRMVGLNRVGESALTIEPLEDVPFC
jgi:hypothetical protein